MAPGWIRREYQPDGPLYARRRLVFSGVVVERDALIPAGLIRSKVKHQRLWQANHAGHEPRERKPYGKTSPAPTAPPAATVQPDTFPAGGVEAVTETAVEAQRVAFKMTPGETIHVAPHGKHKRR